MCKHMHPCDPYPSIKYILISSTWVLLTQKSQAFGWSQSANCQTCLSNNGVNTNCALPGWYFHCLALSISWPWWRQSSLNRCSPLISIKYKLPDDFLFLRLVYRMQFSGSRELLWGPCQGRLCPLILAVSISSIKFELQDLVFWILKFVWTVLKLNWGQG